MAPITGITNTIPTTTTPCRSSRHGARVFCTICVRATDVGAPKSRIKTVSGSIHGARRATISAAGFSLMAITSAAVAGHGGVPFRVEDCRWSESRGVSSCRPACGAAI